MWFPGNCAGADFVKMPSRIQALLETFRELRWRAVAEESFLSRNLPALEFAFALLIRRLCTRRRSGLSTASLRPQGCRSHPKNELHVRAVRAQKRVVTAQGVIWKAFSFSLLVTARRINFLSARLLFAHADKFLLTLNERVINDPDGFDNYGTSDLIDLMDFISFMLTPFVAGLLVAEEDEGGRPGGDAGYPRCPRTMKTRTSIACTAKTLLRQTLPVPARKEFDSISFAEIPYEILTVAPSAAGNSDQCQD
ncbi:hypothetical protein B0H14DRAFT_2646868 [Mycena olivaceomarginata]|nr:hypothetical protein B0H14DRAFT_2646868 [Mycena olivaceomarginata]